MPLKIQSQLRLFLPHDTLYKTKSQDATFVSCLGCYSIIHTTDCICNAHRQHRALAPRLQANDLRTVGAENPAPAAEAVSGTTADSKENSEQPALQDPMQGGAIAAVEQDTASPFNQQAMQDRHLPETNLGSTSASRLDEDAANVSRSSVTNMPPGSGSLQGSSINAVASTSEEAARPRPAEGMMNLALLTLRQIATSIISTVYNLSHGWLRRSGI
jgi:hypothetical protein